MPTALELRTQRARAWEAMKAVGESAGERALSGEEEQAWQKAQEEIEALDKRIAVLERVERTPAPAEEQRRLEETAPESVTRLGLTPAYSAAFRNYLRNGREGLNPEEMRTLSLGRRSLSPGEQRALAVSQAVAGGYLVPDDFVAQIEQAESWFGGMREMATIIRTDNGEDLALPTSNDTTNTGAILAENTQAAESDPTVGQRVYKAFMYSSNLVRVSFQMLQDSAVDVEAWLARLLAERIGRITNTHFTIGDGPNQPSGIALDTVVGRTAPAGQTTTITWDDLIFLEHAVNIAYRRGPGVGWMFHDQTLRDLRRLKDGEGRYIWQPGVPGAAAPSINGYPYVINNDVATMAASARSVYFGKLAKYIIRDVQGFMLLRLEERFADFAQVAFVGFSRHDGGLLDAGTNPVQTYQNAAT